MEAPPETALSGELLPLPLDRQGDVTLTPFQALPGAGASMSGLTSLPLRPPCYSCPGSWLRSNASGTSRPDWSIIFSTPISLVRRLVVSKPDYQKPDSFSPKNVVSSPDIKAAFKTARTVRKSPYFAGKVQVPVPKLRKAGRFLQAQGIGLGRKPIYFKCL